MEGFHPSGGRKGRDSQRYSFTENVLADVTAYASLGKHVYVPAKQILKLDLDCREIEQMPIRLQIDQEIDVTGFVRGPASK